MAAAGPSADAFLRLRLSPAPFMVYRAELFPAFPVGCPTPCAVADLPSLPFTLLNEQLERLLGGDRAALPALGNTLATWLFFEHPAGDERDSGEGPLNALGSWLTSQGASTPRGDDELPRLWIGLDRNL